MKIEKLLKRQDFLATSKGTRWSCACFVMQARLRDAKPQKENDSNSVRLGFAISKKVGSAVIRNKIRRRLRAAANNILPSQCKPGYDVVFIPRREAFDCEFKKLENLISDALKRMKLL